MKKLCIVLALLLALLPLNAAGALAGSTTATVSTPLSGSTKARINNVQLAVDAINGAYVAYGDSFSFNDVVGPRTSAYGYKNAVNGRGVNVVGGGVAQAASTLYLALKQLDGIEYIEKKTYGSRYNGSYVSSSSDAISVDYDDIDFSFYNYYDDFTIDMWTANNRVYCSLRFDSGSTVLGSATIFMDGNSATRNNVVLACGSIYDTTLSYYDAFSFNDIVGPRTSDYGYKAAVNGRGVKVVGGGVAQVASAVYLAVKDLDCIGILEKSSYGSRYNQSYVSDENDAVLTDYNDDIDFRFRYYGDGILSIYTYINEYDEIICEVYESF